MSETTSPFGFKDLDPREKVSQVHGVFARVADKYDLMNDVMSLGVHHVWKDAACARLNPQPGEVIIDCAGGTGDIARRLAKLARAAKARRLARGTMARDADIRIIDYNEAMIMAGREKSAKQKLHEPEISWSVGDAMNLALDDDSVDAYIISFGIRNVSDVQGALNEARRVLKPGGRFFCLEFSHPTSSAVAAIYETYSFKVIPFMGRTGGARSRQLSVPGRKHQTLPGPGNLQGHDGQGRFQAPELHQLLRRRLRPARGLGVRP